MTPSTERRVRSASRAALLVAFALAMPLAACRKSRPVDANEPAYEYAPYRSTVTPEPEEPPLAPQPLRAGTTRTFGDPAPAPTGEPEAETPQTIVTEEVLPMPAEPAREPQRDLSAELNAALEDRLAECGTSLPNGTTQNVSVSAFVTGTGRISRAETSGSSDASLLRCVRAVVESASLTGPIDDAPLQVSVSIPFVGRRRAEERPSTYVLPPGAEAPGVVLPAVVDAVPSGNVPPGVVLPAVVN